MEGCVFHQTLSWKALPKPTDALSSVVATARSMNWVAGIYISIISAAHEMYSMQRQERAELPHNKIRWTLSAFWMRSKIVTLLLHSLRRLMSQMNSWLCTCIAIRYRIRSNRYKALAFNLVTKSNMRWKWPRWLAHPPTN